MLVGERRGKDSDKHSNGSSMERCVVCEVCLFGLWNGRKKTAMRRKRKDCREASLSPEEIGDSREMLCKN